MNLARFVFCLAFVFLPFGTEAIDYSKQNKQIDSSPRPLQDIDWTGLFFGANLSGNKLSNNQTFDLFENGSPTIPSKSTGTVSASGLQIGYDRQVGNAVLGIQSSLYISSILVADKLAEPYGFELCPDGRCSDDVETRITSLKTLSSRLGYLV